MISYAQNFEDVMLWRALKHVGTGFYIDVGANDPVEDSVTKYFYDSGWQGINIEPIDQWHRRLEEQRPRDINLKVAAGSNTGSVTLFEIPDTGLSTANRETAERHTRERGYRAHPVSVPMLTLSEICERHEVKQIHFLKIDVEGAETDVIRGLDLSRFRPWLIVVESTLPNSQDEMYSDWEPLLLGCNYSFVYFDGINRFYLADEMSSELADSFRYPPNFFDEFHLAKVIAAESALKQTAARLAEECTSVLKLQKRLENCEQQRLVLLEKKQADPGNQEILISAVSSAFEGRLSALKAELESARNQLSLLRESNQRHLLLSEERAEEIGALRASWSWRLSAPLRTLFRPLVNYDIHRVSGSLRNTAKNVTQWAIAKPRLVALVHNVVDRSPKLRQYITRHVELALTSGSLIEISGGRSSTSRGLRNHAGYVPCSSRSAEILDDIKNLLDDHQE